METAAIEKYSQRVERLRQEAEALSAEAADFPALAKNAERLLACVAMMEINLGKNFVPPAGEPEA